MLPPRDFDWTDVPADWPFDQAPNVVAITTAGVIERGLPILHVTHYDEDDSWAFLCGTTNETDDGRVVTMKTALKMDPSLREIANLQPGYSAYRYTLTSPWVRRKDA